MGYGVSGAGGDSWGCSLMSRYKAEQSNLWIGINI